MAGLLNRRRHHETADINITAFMNLMVILVPFLLITAVFSRVSVLELNLPGPSAESNDEIENALNLEVTVRETAIEVGDRRTGLLKRFKVGPDGHDYKALSSFLKQVKARSPNVDEATLLLEPDIPYDVLVQVMDAVRVVVVEEADTGTMAMAELFPEISIGDAPAAGR
jgi:biopolymer transport protein ExbD